MSLEGHALRRAAERAERLEAAVQRDQVDLAMDLQRKEAEQATRRFSDEAASIAQHGPADEVRDWLEDRAADDIDEIQGAVAQSLLAVYETAVTAMLHDRGDSAAVMDSLALVLKRDAARLEMLAAVLRQRNAVIRSL